MLSNWKVKLGKFQIFFGIELQYDLIFKMVLQLNGIRKK